MPKDNETPRLPAFMIKPNAGETKEAFKARVQKELAERGLLKKPEQPAE